MVAAKRGAPTDTPQWLAFKRVADAQGRRREWVAEQLGERLNMRMDFPRLWHILREGYGYPEPAGFREGLADVLGVEVDAIFGEEPDVDLYRHLSGDGDTAPTA